MKIHYKITLIIALTVAVILAGVFHYLNKNLKALYYNRIQNTLDRQVAIVKTFLENSDSTLLAQNIDAIADQAGKDLGLRVTVINLDGRVIGDSELSGKALEEVENHLYRPEIQDAFKKDFGESRRFSTTIQENMLYMARPFGKDRPEGVIRLSIPLSEISEVTRSLRSLLFVAVLIAFVLSLIIGFFASLTVSKPIEQISQTAKGVAEGDFSRRLTPAGNDEIGELGNSINFMSQQIQQRINDLISNKSRVEAILLSMFEGVMVIDGKGNIRLMNETLKRFLRVEEDLVGQRPLEVIRNIEVQEIIEEVLKNTRGVVSRELTILMPEEKILQLHATPVMIEGQVDGAVLVFHDITELRHLENVRRDFVANVSHELRTPITNIKGYSETLLEGAINDKENAEDFLKIICSDSSRLAQLVEDLLELSKIESGKLNLELYPVAVEDVVGRVFVGVKKQAQKQKVSFKVEIPESLPKVMGDANKLAQVFLNLMDNAIKYNKDGGSVTVTAHESDEFVQIDIADTGLGIPKADIPRVFERFYRVDKARSRDLGGTGLGLSIAKHIIQSHRGTISLDSELGQGSAFHIKLPKSYT